MELSQLQIAEELDDGGQAKVFALSDNPHLVLKRYHNPDHQGMHRPTLHELLSMRSALNAMGMPVDRWAAWPLEPVEDAGKLVGFLMPRVGSSFMIEVGGRSRLANLSYLAQEPRPIWGAVRLPSQEVRVRILVTLAGTMQALHDRSLVIGDLSFGNILWSEGPPASVFLLDCDGIRPEGRPPVLPQADTLDWADPQASKGTSPDKDRDRYKLALAVLRVLSRRLDAYPTPNEGHDLRDTAPEIAGAVDGLLRRAAGPVGSRPTAAQWRLALEARTTIPVTPPVPRTNTTGPPPKPELLQGRGGERKWRSV